jgi:serine/threonine protein kinase
LVFFTMELLTGATLGRVLQARKLVPLPVDQALAATREIGAALAYAHSRSIVHGDISPRNIFITGQGDVRVLGFPGSFRGQNAGSLDHELTLPIATSGYASCQVLDGERPDARDDVFALACIAYLLLCGEHPLKQKTAIEARDARMSIRRPAHLNHRQWQALRAGLRWERQNRPGDVLQWLQQLDLRGAAKRLPPLSDMLEPPPRKKPRSPWAAATAVGVLLLLAAAYWFISHRGILPRLEPAASSPLPALETTPPVVAAAPPALKVSDAPAAKPSNNMPPPSVAAVSTPPPTPQPAASSAVSSPPAKAPPIAAAATASAPVATAGAGSSRLELSADTVDVPSGETEAQVSVHRKGSLRGETSFTWWTESGTAKPGTDFSAVMPQIAHIGDGKSTVTLSILLSKAPHTQAKSFYVVIDQAEGGAPLAGRTLTMVTLQPPG